MPITIRPATPDDAPFLGQVVLAALDKYDFTPPSPAMGRQLEQVVGMCRREDTLYSYLRARVAAFGQQPVGALIAYDGGNYAALRQTTFALVKEQAGLDLQGSAMETGPGEFYLDSMAILPAFRGQRLGHRLMLDAIEQGSLHGLKRFSLIVDVTHPKVRAYYASLGFEPLYTMQAFGATFCKMVRNL